MMLRSYVKIAVRNLKKDKAFSVINILGLSLGLATCLLISLFVIDELSYDRFNEKADRIFRLSADLRLNDNAFNELSTPYPMGIELARDYPQVESQVRLALPGDILVKATTETLMEHHAVFADSTFFDVFTIPLVSGNPHTALTRLKSMVISETMAAKYFQGVDPVGKALVISNTDTCTITAVMKDMPAKSHFHFDFIRSLGDIEQSRSNEWLNNTCVTYLLARPGVTAAVIQHCVDESIRRFVAPQLQAVIHSSLEDLSKGGNHIRYPVTPLSRIHLYSNLPDEIEPNGNIQYVTVFILIAVFILLVAGVNFMNLSTARSASRSREVGVRKVLGSLRSNLIGQFLTESTLTSLLALALGLGIAWLLLPYFNELSGKQIHLNLFDRPWLLPALLVSALFVGLAAGIYPAFYLSSFEPVQVLKGRLTAGFRAGWLRNSLVVFQFATAILLIVGTLVIYSQLSFIRNTNVGYNREQLLTIHNTYSLWVHARSFKDELKQLPGVENATMTRNLPNGAGYDVDGYFKDATLNMNQAILLGRWQIDADFIPTLGMQMASGRNFSPDLPTDSSSVLINETAAKLLAFANPLDKTIYGVGQNNEAVPYRIIGVVRDFHPRSLHEKIGPLLFHLAEERGAITLRIRSTNIPALISRISDAYHGMDKMAGQPFQYSFFDDDFDHLYQADQRVGKIFFSFASFAILIACLGLFGLVTYAAEQRTKEIGIRKVLGATVANLVTLLSQDFLKLIGVSMLIAFPLAWWGMHKWLESFAYRTGISWWVFVVAGFLAAAITMITVSFRAIRSALANPVKSLRPE